MAESLTIIGIEVPRAPQYQSGGEHRVFGEWEIGGQRILERKVKQALKLASDESLTLITGEPDQGVFNLVENYRVAEADLMSWILGVTDGARVPNKEDVVVFMRGDVVLRSHEVIEKAIEVLRVIPDISRVEVAYQPKKQSPRSAISIGVEGGELIENRFDLPAGDIGLTCPLFEVQRLKNFKPDTFDAPKLSGMPFLWIDEDDFVVLETPLDFLRSELLLSE